MKKIVILAINIAIIVCVKNAFGIAGIIPEPEKKIVINKEWKGFYCGYTEPAKVVIHTEEQWKEVWQKLNILRLPVPELPKINFAREMAIAVFMGQRTSGGYEITIKNIIQKKDKIIIEVHEKEPSPDTLRTMSLTQPYYVMVIKNSSLPIEFQYQH